MNNSSVGEDDNADAAVESAVILKFGLDVHAVQVAVCVRVDRAAPQPAKMVARERLAKW